MQADDNPPRGLKNRFDIFLEQAETLSEKCRAAQQHLLTTQWQEIGVSGPKILRKFTHTETSALLGISKTFLDKFIADNALNDCPSGAKTGNNRREFALADILKIRTMMYENSKDGKYRRWRDKSKGEQLLTIAVGNFKGGSGKTTTTLTLAQYMALQGYHVLVVDLDSQASATSTFGILPDDYYDHEYTIMPYLRGEKPLSGTVKTTHWPNIDIIPANLSLHEFEAASFSTWKSKGDSTLYSLLRDGLKDPVIQDTYDVVLIDCPPSLGNLTTNAMYAANGILITMPPRMFDFASTGQFLKMTHEVFTVYSQDLDYEAPDLYFAKMLLTNVMARKSATGQRQMTTWANMTFGEMVMAAVFPNSNATDVISNRKQTLYEIPLGNIEGVSRQTHKSAIESCNEIGEEFLSYLTSAWKEQHIGEPSQLTLDEVSNG